MKDYLLTSDSQYLISGNLMFALHSIFELKKLVKTLHYTKWIDFS